MTHVLARDARGLGTVLEINFDLIVGSNGLCKLVAKEGTQKFVEKMFVRTLGFGFLKIERRQNAD